MKRAIFCLTLALFSMVGFAQNEQPQKTNKNIKGAEIAFDNLSFDFGTLKVGDIKHGSYTFTNIGKKPLILDDVKTSCTCTTIEYPKAPTMPGQQGEIKVTYSADTPGSINKWITVLSNAETDRVILKTAGKVE